MLPFRVERSIQNFQTPMLCATSRAPNRTNASAANTWMTLVGRASAKAAPGRTYSVDHDRSSSIGRPSVQRRLADHLASIGIDDYLVLREQLLDMLRDEDLGMRLGGDTPTLGSLCHQMGEVEHAYVESFRTFRMNGSPRQPDRRLETSVAALRSWYGELDRDLMAALDGLSEDDLERPIVRTDFDPAHYSPRPIQQLADYLQALLIFYGKASIYLRALERPLPPQWQRDIG